jgi:glucose-6-phosphate isomerase
LNGICQDYDELVHGKDIFRITIMPSGVCGRLSEWLFLSVVLLYVALENFTIFYEEQCCGFWLIATDVKWNI